jgi:hypothetical protein
MAYASVKVFAPDEHKIEYQNGRTDRAGVFSFCPDKSGEWLVVVDDGSGHGFQKKIEVDNVPDVMTAPAGPGAAQKILMVVCVLWGFAVSGFSFAGAGACWIQSVRGAGNEVHDVWMVQLVPLGDGYAGCDLRSGFRWNAALRQVVFVGPVDVKKYAVMVYGVLD